MKTELKLGILLQTIYLVLIRFFNIPDFVLGILLGLALSLLIIGVLPEAYYKNIKDKKCHILDLLLKN